MKSLSPLSAAASIGAVILFFVSPAFGQNLRASSWEQFHPGASQHTSSLNLDRPVVLDHLQVSAGLFTHFVDDPIQVLSEDGDRVRSRIVDDQLKTEFGASIGLFDVLQVNVAVPVVPYQSGEGLAAVGGESGATGAYVSEIRTSVDAPLVVASEAGGFGLGVSGHVYIPSGANASFNSDRTVRGGPTLHALWRTRSDFELLANLGFEFRSRNQVRNFVTGHNFRWGVGTVVPLPMADGRFAALANVFGSATTVEAPDANAIDRYGDAPRPVEALAGLRFDVNEKFRLQAGGGTGLTAGPGAPDFRLFASAHFRTGRTPDEEPPAAEPAPREPEPEPAPPPEPQEPSDRDGDGIADADDACPDAPETFNAIDDDDGCPDEKEAGVKVVKLQIWLAKSPHFETDKDEIRVQDTPTLQDLIGLLKTYPELTKLRIEGHADSRGTDEYNQKLSERRAEAVVRYLVDRGIDRDRLEAVGLGERENIADNRTPQGRWQNRRVDIFVEEVNGEPVEDDSIEFEKFTD